jgi:hypothetical protein
MLDYDQLTPREIEQEIAHNRLKYADDCEREETQ